MSEAMKWYSLDEIAKHLEISRDTLTKLIKEQNFPAHKVGVKYKFDVKEVDAWVRESRADKS
jgi:excisionase family DNA binding protein